MQRKKWSRDKSYEVYIYRGLKDQFKEYFIDVECTVGIRGDTLERCVHVRVRAEPYKITMITPRLRTKQLGTQLPIVYRKMFPADDMEHVTHRVITALRLLLHDP